MAYRDTGGVLTIGYGHTGRDIKEGMTISREGAEEFLDRDLIRAAEDVERLVNVKLTDNEFSALVSFVFNVGSHQFRESTLLRLLNQDDKKSAADEFPKWCKDNGNVLHGLLLRRIAEQELFERVDN
jgi:lysozyme